MSDGNVRDRAPVAVRRRWWIALSIAFLWHLIVGGVLEIWQPWKAEDVAARDYEPLDIVFSSPPPDQPESGDEDDRPREFTELPEDRADLEPEDPDFISNVDSRARDRATADEETDLPRLEGESEAPHVAMAPPEEVPQESGSGNERATESTGDPRRDDTTEILTRRTQGRSLPPTDSEGEGQASSEEDGLRNQMRGRQGLPSEDGDRSGFTPESKPPRHRVGASISDIVQEEMANPRGNVVLMGDVSMNTQAWAWAPWLQGFRRDFLRGWINFVPYAYHIGVVDGRQVVELEIAPDGRLLHMEVVEREGHRSLEEATLANFRSFAPYRPLSNDGSFPEETLRMSITVIYPDR